jgi:hypothetical protein
MKIEINNHFAADGKEFYYWTLYDGPDGIDEVKGFATDLIEVFSKIIEWRERIGADYAQELTQDLDTPKQSLNTSNETH